MAKNLWSPELQQQIYQLEQIGNNLLQMVKDMKNDKDCSIPAEELNRLQRDAARYRILRDRIETADKNMLLIYEHEQVSTGKHLDNVLDNERRK